jgi:hypothetical protein
MLLALNCHFFWFQPTGTRHADVACSFSRSLLMSTNKQKVSECCLLLDSRSLLCVHQQAQGKPLVPVAPMYSYAGVSLSNVVATTCQYEVRRFTPNPKEQHLVFFQPPTNGPNTCAMLPRAGVLLSIVAPETCQYEVSRLGR